MISQEIYDLIEEVEKRSPEQIASLDPDVLEAYREALQVVADSGIQSRRLIESPDTFDANNTYDISGRVAVNTLGNSQYDNMEYLAAKNPNYSFAVLNDQIVARPKNSPEAKWRPLDPSTLELFDVPEALDEVGAGVASQLGGLVGATAMLPGGPGAIAAGAAGGAGAASTAYDLARQAAGRVLGVNKGINVGDAALGGLIDAPLTALTYGVKPSAFIKDGVLQSGAREQLASLLGKNLNKDAMKTLKSDISYMSDNEVARQLSKKLSSPLSKAGELAWDTNKQLFSTITGRDPGVLDYMKASPLRQNLPKGTRYSEGVLGFGSDVPAATNQGFLNDMIKRITNISGKSAENTLKAGSKLEERVAGKQIDTREAFDIITKYRDLVKKRMEANNGYNAPYYRPIFNKLDFYANKLLTPDEVTGGFNYANDYSIIKSLVSEAKELQRQQSQGLVPDLGEDQARIVLRALKDIKKPLEKNLRQTVKQEQSIVERQGKALAANSSLGRKFMTQDVVPQFDLEAGMKFAADDRDAVNLTLGDLKKSLDTQSIPDDMKRKLYNKALVSIRRAQTSSMLNNNFGNSMGPSQGALATLNRALVKAGTTASGQLPVGVKRVQEVLSGTALDSSKYNQPFKLGGLLSSGKELLMGEQYDPADVSGEQEKWNRLAEQMRRGK